TTAPQSKEYAGYADAHWRELIERYQPAILWNDITYPRLSQLAQIVADYYNRFPDGLINNRFGADFADFTTPEYAQYDGITEKKWESCRGLGFSFGYNQIEDQRHVIASGKLIEMLIDITSKNGNLLLNIGPKPDGSIPAIQLDRLKALGAWLRVNGEAIFDSKPWVRPSAGPGVRFTKKGDSLYAFLFQPPAAGAFTVPGVLAPEGMKVELLGQAGAVTWNQQDNDVVVAAPAQLPGAYALTLKMTPAPRPAVRA
ncbi:MAG: alpha-L-fucosidase, partial [Bryobacteraceae bacterium]|nr:alpha-L-fucosidase [Bryobacteraceae bacterium]